MSGFALLVAAVLISFILLWANAVILEGEHFTTTSEAESVIQRIKMEERRAKEAYTLSIVEKSSQTISARITNIGLIPLPVNTFAHCDVIVTFYDLELGGYSSYWLPYNYQGTEGYWYVDSVYTGNTQGEGINPFDVTTSSGHLDPGEAMVVIANLPSRSTLDVNYPSAMLFATPSGARVIGVG